MKEYYQEPEYEQRSNITLLNALYGAILGGVIIKEQSFLTKTKVTPNRTHRKKRIVKKWRKRYGVDIEVLPDPHIYQVGSYVICHPDTARKLRAAISKIIDNG